MEVDGQGAVEGGGIEARVIRSNGKGDDVGSFMRDDGKLGARGDDSVRVVSRDGDHGEIVLVRLDLGSAFDRFGVVDLDGSRLVDCGLRHDELAVGIDSHQAGGDQGRLGGGELDCAGNVRPGFSHQKLPGLIDADNAAVRQDSARTETDRAVGADGSLLKSRFTDGRPGGVPVREVHPGVHVVIAVRAGNVVEDAAFSFFRQFLRGRNINAADEVGVHAVRPFRLDLRVLLPDPPVTVGADMRGEAIPALRPDAGVLAGNPPVAVFPDDGGVSLFPLQDAAFKDVLRFLGGLVGAFHFSVDAFHEAVHLAEPVHGFLGGFHEAVQFPVRFLQFVGGFLRLLPGIPGGSGGSLGQRGGEPFKLEGASRVSGEADGERPVRRGTCIQDSFGLQRTDHADAAR